MICRGWATAPYCPKRRRLCTKKEINPHVTTLLKNARRVKVMNYGNKKFRLGETVMKSSHKNIEKYRSTPYK